MEHFENGNNRRKLYKAAEKGNWKIVNRCLKKGADPEIAFSGAACGGHLKIVEYLLEKKLIEVNLLRAGGQTLLHMALESQDMPIAKLLIRYGADIHLKDGRGVSPFDICTTHHIWEVEELKFALEERGIEVSEDKMPLCELDQRLVHAVQDGDVEKVRDYLQSSANPNLIGEDDETLIHHSVNNDKPEILEELLEHGGNANATDSIKETALLRASKRNNLQIVKILLEYGAYPIPPGRILDSPLYAASQRGFGEVAETMINHLASTNNAMLTQFKNFIKDIGMLPQYKFRPTITSETELRKRLIEAVLSDDREEFSRLLGTRYYALMNMIFNEATDWRSLLNETFDRFPDSDVIKEIIHRLEKTEGLNHQDPIYFFKAASAGLTEICKLFVEKGIDANVKDDKGLTALSRTTSKKAIETMKYLIKHGISVREGFSLEKPPIHVAAENGRDDIVRLILKKGGEINILDTEGHSALDLAAQKAVRWPIKYEPIVDLLKSIGAVSTSISHDKTKENFTLDQQLLEAVDNHERDRVIELLKQGANVNATDSQGLAPLEYAADNGDLRTMQILLDHGADNLEDAIFGAICSHQPESVKFLLESGANVNYVTDNGQGYNFAFLAIMNSDMPVFELLLDFSIDLDWKTSEGTTVLEFAQGGTDKRWINCIMNYIRRNHLKDSAA